MKLDSAELLLNHHQKIMICHNSEEVAFQMPCAAPAAQREGANRHVHAIRTCHGISHRRCARAHSVRRRRRRRQPLDVRTRVLCCQRAHPIATPPVTFASILLQVVRDALLARAPPLTHHHVQLAHRVDVAHKRFVQHEPTSFQVNALPKKTGHANQRRHERF